MIVRATYHAYNELGARRHARGGGGVDRRGTRADRQRFFYVSIESRTLRSAARLAAILMSSRDATISVNSAREISPSPLTSNSAISARICATQPRGRVVVAATTPPAAARRS